MHVCASNFVVSVQDFSPKTNFIFRGGGCGHGNPQVFEHKRAQTMHKGLAVVSTWRKWLGEKLRLPYPQPPPQKKLIFGRKCYAQTTKLDAQTINIILRCRCFWVFILFDLYLIHGPSLPSTNFLGLTCAVGRRNVMVHVAGRSLINKNGPQFHSDPAFHDLFLPLGKL